MTILKRMTVQATGFNLINHRSAREEGIECGVDFDCVEEPEKAWQPIVLGVMIYMSHEESKQFVIGAKYDLLLCTHEEKLDPPTIEGKVE